MKARRAQLWSGCRPEGCPRPRACAKVAAALRAHLQKSFDLSTLPRSFRYIKEMPVDAQGKVSMGVLKSLFQSGFNPAVLRPQKLKATSRGAKLIYRYRVPEDLAYFQGHFPGHPVVPGIVQIQWVVDAAAEWLGRRPAISRMEAVKFKQLLRPRQTFSLCIEKEISGERGVLKFTLAEGKTFYSSGRLVMA